MGLSEQEQRMLDEIESALYAEDPKFGSTMSAHVFDDDSSSGGRGLSVQVIVLIIVGLMLLVGGVAAAMFSKWFLALSVVGFLLMFGSGVWAVTGKPSENSKPMGGSARVSRLQPRTGSKSSKRKSGGESSFESRFRNRFEGR